MEREPQFMYNQWLEPRMERTVWRIHAQLEARMDTWREEVLHDVLAFTDPSSCHSNDYTGDPGRHSVISDARIQVLEAILLGVTALFWVLAKRRHVVLASGRRKTNARLVTWWLINFLVHVLSVRVNYS